MWIFYRGAGNFMHNSRGHCWNEPWPEWVLFVICWIIGSSVAQKVWTCSEKYNVLDTFRSIWTRLISNRILSELISMHYFQFSMYYSINLLFLEFVEYIKSCNGISPHPGLPLWLATRTCDSVQGQFMLCSIISTIVAINIMLGTNRPNFTWCINQWNI